MKRPRELLYAGGERPPARTLLGLAAQHTATALALIAYVLAAAHIGKLDASSTQAMITATVLGMAISTFLQAWGGRLGSGMLLVHMPDPILVMLSGLLAGQYGLGGLVAVGVVNGLVAMGAGTLVPHLRSLLPPTVAGVVVCVAGLTLVDPALGHMSGLADGPLDPGDLLAGGVTLAVIMGLSIWGGSHGKLFALLAGLLAGLAVSLSLGKLEGLERLAAAPLLALPHPPVPNFDVDPGVLLAVGVLALMTQLDTFGSVVLMHKMNDADWRRPQMDMVAGGMRACGVANFIGAWLGGQPTAISSANIALAHISRSTSRWIGLAVAGMLGLMAFLPQVAIALTLIPTAVIGAIEVYAAAYLVVSGIELVASRALDVRGLFMVGLSFVLGLGVVFLPDLALLAPPSLRLLAGNGIIVAGVCAILLNLLFRLGISQKARLDFDPGMAPAARLQAAVDFVESQGAAWSARRDVVRRAAQAVLEAAEAVQAARAPARRLVAMRASFDEFNLDVELLHEGPPLPLAAGATATRPDLLELDDAGFDAALEEALSGVSRTMLARLAERLSYTTRDGQACLRLHFDH